MFDTVYKQPEGYGNTGIGYVNLPEIKWIQSIPKAKSSKN